MRRRVCSPIVVAGYGERIAVVECVEVCVATSSVEDGRAAGGGGGAGAWGWVGARRRGVLVRLLVRGRRRGFSRIWPCIVGDVRRRVLWGDTRVFLRYPG